jgi:hypothetical protein
MNYFTHGLPFLSDAYFLAGTAVPDWLSVVDRRMRVRSRAAQPFCAHADPRIAALATGIVQHHHDDRWFHQTRAFAELSLELTRRARQLLPGDEGFRPSFLGHILVEILLDASLIASHPAKLDDYYRALSQLDLSLLNDAVNAMATKTSPRLGEIVELFCRERFLYDYLQDAKLLRRLNHVMRRVGLPLLPDAFGQLLADARGLVDARRGELLSPRYDSGGDTELPGDDS